MTKVKENRSHRDPILNPRRWPEGGNRVSVSKEEKYLIHGYTALLSKPEMELIYYLAKTQLGGLYANLGHASGGSASLMSEGLYSSGCDGVVHSFDLLPHPKSPLPNNVKYHCGSTLSGAEQMKDQLFSFIFIDADHSFDGVVSDFKAWWPLLEEGGIIAFHDTNQDFSHQAIEQFVVPVAKEIKTMHVDRIRVFCRSI